MVAWYRHDIAAWMDGTEGLSDAEYRVYHLVCQLIYMHEGPIRRHDRGIAGRCNQDVRRTKWVINRLLESGKLVEKDGFLHNERATLELRLVDNRGTTGTRLAHHRGTTGRQPTPVVGQSSADPSCKSLKTNNPSLAGARTRKTRLDKTREEKRVVQNRPNGRSPPLPVQTAFENWNKAAPILGLSSARVMTNDRKSKLSARIKEHGLDGWNLALEELARSTFCQGKNDRGWKADFDFMLTPHGFNRLIEGGYADNEVDDGN